MKSCRCKKLFADGKIDKEKIHKNCIILRHQTHLQFTFAKQKRNHEIRTYIFQREKMQKREEIVTKYTFKKWDEKLIKKVK